DLLAKSGRYEGARSATRSDGRSFQTSQCFVFLSDLNETPNRIATLRMRSGVRFMVRAASSNDFDALASSITRRSSAKDQDLPAIGEALLIKDKAAERSMFA